MIIRSETVADYAAIADLHARAFGHRSHEALIIALHRHRAVFDAELSLVAEIDGCVVGHALFSPHRVRLLGQDTPAVNLAPIAVDPGRQGRGIGGRLIVEGHSIASAKGYAFSFLLGHTSYYPRFGYRTHAVRVRAGDGADHRAPHSSARAAAAGVRGRAMAACAVATRRSRRGFRAGPRRQPTRLA